MKILSLCLLFYISLFAQEFDFNLKAEKITKDTYMVKGKKEYFSQNNAGDIANSSFIITSKGIIVIDTGSSYLYGKQLVKLIRTISSKKIVYVINTHHHPDHFLGNQAFKNSKILATAYSKNYIQKNGNDYILNLVNIIQYAMKETEVLAPTNILKDKYLHLGNHKLRILYLKGHTSSDIALYDEKTKVLFASDLVFNNRIAATPHANIKQWIRSLSLLEKINYSYLVPGHGKVSKNKQAIKQTISYLKYLDKVLKDSAKKGLSVFEILELQRPKEFQNLSMVKDEFERSVINLYPKYEDLK